MYAEIKEAIVQYNQLFIKFEAFAEQLKQLPDFLPPAIVWGKHEHGTFEFSFFDRQVRLHFDAVKFHGGLIGRITVARVQKGENMDLLRPVFFNAGGSAFLEKPETQPLRMVEDFEAIASYMLMTLLPSSGRGP